MSPISSLSLKYLVLHFALLVGLTQIEDQLATSREEMLTTQLADIIRKFNANAQMMLSWGYSSKRLSLLVFLEAAYTHTSPVSMSEELDNKWEELLVIIIGELRASGTRQSLLATYEFQLRELAQCCMMFRHDLMQEVREIGISMESNVATAIYAGDITAACFEVGGILMRIQARADNLLTTHHNPVIGAAHDEPS